MNKKPRFYRESKDNRISWEIWGWHSWFITISLSTFELQINKWRKDGTLY